MITFANPKILWLLLILLPIAVWYVLNNKKSHASMLVSSLSAFAGLSTSWKVWLMHILFVFRLMAIACVIVIIARPQTHDRWSTSETEGTDILVKAMVNIMLINVFHQYACSGFPPQ